MVILAYWLVAAHEIDLVSRMYVQFYPSLAHFLAKHRTYMTGEQHSLAF